MYRTLVFALCLALAASEVVELTDDNFADKTADGFWLVKFFAPWCGHCKRMAPTWDHLGKELAGKANIAKVDCTQYKDLCSKFEVKGFPTIKLLKGGEIAEAYQGARTATAFVDFLKKHAELAQDVTVAELPSEEPKKEAPKQEAEPEGPSDVVNLSAADLEKLEGDWFVKFYAPWCGHCKKLAPTWSTLATQLKGKANIGKVDCTIEKDACSKFGVKGYPTLKLLKNGEDTDKYNGGRDLKSLTNFLKEKGVVAQDTVVEDAATPAPKAAEKPAAKAEGPSAVTVLDESNFETTAGAGYWFVKFYAPWCGHCKKLAPVWDHLAEELKGKANIAKVDCTQNNDLCTKFGVRGYPTLKLLKDGVEDEAYKSGRDMDSFVKFLKDKSIISADTKVKGLSDEKPSRAKKEAEAKEEGPTNIVVLGDDFAEKVAAGSHFVKFYAPWCGHCKRLAPTWETLATTFNTEKSPVKIAKVDCTVHKTLCKDKGVSGYPTLKLFTNGEEVEAYRGGRDLEALSKYLTDKGLTAPEADKHVHSEL